MRAARSFALALGLLATGCQGGSTPASPSSTSAASAVSIAGVVRDLLQRPIRDARVEVVEGPSSGIVATTDAQGQFVLNATASNDRVAVIVSKDGFESASLRLRAGQTALYLRDLAVPDLDGRHTIVFIADASCTQLPVSLKGRSYTAAVTQSASTSASLAAPSIFVGALSGADFYQGFEKLSITAVRDAVRFSVFSWDAFNWWLEDDPIIERVTPTSHFSVSGTATAAVATAQSTITAALDGTFSFCAESKPGAQPQWPPTCAVPPIECKSANHRVTMTR
ncbi:MAG TPA: carboxypeptidase-like regulatory domain-containing protein [Vicinamibacterales bacterium]